MLVLSLKIAVTVLLSLVALLACAAMFEYKTIAIEEDFAIVRSSLIIGGLCFAMVLSLGLILLVWVGIKGHVIIIVVTGVVMAASVMFIGTCVELSILKKYQDYISVHGSKARENDKPGQNDGEDD
jgi:hypothetical protein